MRPYSTLKKVLLASCVLAALCVLLLGAGIYYLIRVDLDSHKDFISAMFLEETGRRLELRGEIDHTLYPWLGVELDGIRIGNAEGAVGTKLRLSSGKMALRVKLLPLLTKKLEVDTVRIDGLCLDVLIEEDVRNDWGSVSEQQVDEDVLDEDVLLDLGALIVGGVDISNACLHVTDRLRDRSFKLDNMTLKTQYVPGQPQPVRFEATLQSDAPKLNGKISLQAQVRYLDGGRMLNIDPLEASFDLDSRLLPAGQGKGELKAAVSLDFEDDTVVVTGLVLNALGMRASGDGTLSDFRDEEPTVTAELAVSGKDIALPFRIAGMRELADSLERQRGRQFDAKVSLGTGDGHVRLRPLRLSLLGSDIDATVELDARRGTRRANGKIVAKGPDLPLLMKLAGVFVPDDARLSRYAGQLSRLKDRSFDISTQFDADLSAGNIQIPNLNARVLGVAANANVEGTSLYRDGGSLSGALTVVAKDAGSLLNALQLGGGMSKTLKSLDMEARFSGAGRQLQLSPLRLKAGFAGAKIPGGKVEIEARTQAVLDWKRETLRLEGFKLSGLGLDMGAQLSLEDYSGDREFEAQVRIAPFRPRRLLEQLEIPVPDTASKDAFGRFALSAVSLSGSADALRIEDIQAQLDESRLQGSITVKGLDGDAVAYDMRLSMDKLNLDDYLPPRTPGAAGGGAAAATETTLPMETLRGLDIRSSLSVGTLEFGGIRLEQAALDLRAKDGDVRLAPVNARLYGGKYQGELALDASGKRPALSMRSHFEGVEIEPLLVALNGSSQISGKGDLTLSLRSDGRDIGALRNNLAGGGRLELRQAVLQGIDIGSVLRQLEVLIREKRFGKVDRGETTRIDTLEGTLKLEKGVVRSDDLLVRSPEFQVKGDGVLANLRDATWDYRLLAEVSSARAKAGEKRYDTGGYALPIHCSGKIRDHKCLPDIRSILEKFIKDTLVDKVIKKGLGEMLSDALGKPETKQQQADRQPPVEGPDAAMKQQEEKQEEKQEDMPKPPSPEELGKELLEGMLDKLF